MSSVAYYVAVPIVRSHDGALITDETRAVLARTPSDALSRARAMVRDYAGAIAFNRTGDPSTGEFKDAVIIGCFGEYPESIGEPSAD